MKSRTQDLGYLTLLVAALFSGIIFSCSNPSSGDSDLNSGTTAYVQIALASAMTGEGFPESEASTLTGTAVEVEIDSEEESENDGPPSGDPPSGDPPSGDPPSASSVRVADVTAEISNLTLQVGSDESGINFCWNSSVTDKGYTTNQVAAENLSPNTKYVYRVGDGTTYSEVFEFETQDSSDFNFIFVGDPQLGASHDVDGDQEGWEATVTQAITAFPDTSFILSAGDQVEDSSDEDQYTAFLSADELSSIPIAACIGNHDNNEIYQNHFNLPNESSTCGSSDAGGDYYFTYGKALFMVLNSNVQSVTTHKTFIEDSISAAGDDIVWNVVVFHHSIYSTARHAEDTDILSRRSDYYPVFDDNDIDVVLMGHDHVYCRSYQLKDGSSVTTTSTTVNGVTYDADNPDGTLYITANSASGSKYYDLATSFSEDSTYRAYYEQREEASYSNVEITDTSFTITTYDSDDNNEVDSYSIYKGE